MGKKFCQDTQKKKKNQQQKNSQPLPKSNKHRLNRKKWEIEEDLQWLTIPFNPYIC